MYSFHSSPEEKNKLLYALAQHGIETTVDRVAKKKRIRDWIQESVIQEDDEEEETETANPSVLISRAPVAGHVSSVQAEERLSKKPIVTTVKDAAKKHLDPRTGRIQQGPSEMGALPVKKFTDNEVHTNGVHKLVDVGSQTSSETQANIESRLEEHSRHTSSPSRTPFEPCTYFTSGRQQNVAAEPLSASRGLIAAFNSVATITVPESQRNHTITHQNMLKNKQVNDSGYGSLDKLRATSSPVMRKRSNGQVQVRNGHYRPKNGGDRHRNKEHSPFESDSGGDGSPTRSSGFANLSTPTSGTMNRSTIITSTMKDTPYDHIKPRRNKIK